MKYMNIILQKVGRNMYTIRLEKMPALMARKRDKLNLSVRGASEVIGLAPSTYSRAENGGSMSAETYYVLVMWLSEQPKYTGATRLTIKEGNVEILNITGCNARTVMKIMKERDELKDKVQKFKDMCGKVFYGE